MQKIYLHLEDGTSIEGLSCGYDGDSCGEVVFSTGMTGYPQSLTDPSFASQILVFTYPLIGNYGVPKPIYQYSHLMKNFESERIQVQGVVVSSHLETPSHYQMEVSLSSWLKSQKVPAISHIDTRALTLKLREKGVMLGAISRTKGYHFDDSVLKNLVSKVSLPEVIAYKPIKSFGKRILLIDCGVKHGILRELLVNGYEVLRIPWDEDPMKHIAGIDGVVCSNGPGDPKDCAITVEHIQRVIKANIPFLGICLGHQLVALAIGADTYKLPYGHRGLNQPCRDTITNKAYVTSQNHGYAVKRETLPRGFTEWFVNLNDGTNEGLQNSDRKIWSTQFHPEGSPGPFDTNWIFSLLKK